MTLSLILAVIPFFILLLIVLDYLPGIRTLKILSTIPPLEGDSLPKVSLIIPARNEETNAEKAVRSMLALDYPHLELMVIDDRSTDGTGAILDRLAREHPRLKVVHIQELPPDWLGKNHALWVGARASTGDYLLFTDGDIFMDPTLLRRAMNLLLDLKLDHLVGLPDVIMPSPMLKAMTGSFSVFFNLYAFPWKARNPKSSHHLGIGAFNLVKTSVYHAMGTHQAIALRPDDDMKLGLLVKRHGYRQDAFIGRGLLAVEWYPSFKAMVHGLMKNSFAGLEYSLARVVISTLAIVFMFAWPFVGLLISTGSPWLLHLGSCLLLILIYMDTAHLLRTSLGYAFMIPVTSLIFCGIIWRSTLLNLFQGGIWWRDTFYPLDALKRNRI